MEKKLEVKNLTISFRTNNGKVQAVRDISFDLHAGETLAIVGESGSGKSVTSRAILGILAGNSIVENGEIIYDDKDLLKIAEEDFHFIRGDKIAMIFQDPMSSLNPIIKIGKQLTEAMILKSVLRRKENADIFKKKTKLLKKVILDYYSDDKVSAINELEQLDLFIHVCDIYSKNYTEYNKALNAIKEINELCTKLYDELNKNIIDDVNRKLYNINTRIHIANNPYFGNDLQLTHFGNNIPPQALIEKLSYFIKKTGEIIQSEGVDFFALSYLALMKKQKLTHQFYFDNKDNLELKQKENFDGSLLKIIEKRLKWYDDHMNNLKRESIEALKQSLNTFEKPEYNRNEINQLAKMLYNKVKSSTDKLRIKKFSYEYTFKSSLESNIKRYFKAIIKNESERIRFKKENEKYKAAVAAGKKLDWKVVPANITDLDVIRGNIIKMIENLINVYEEILIDSKNIDFEKAAIELYEYLKEKAIGRYSEVTDLMAKQRAIELMTEVGIADAAKRYKQYPFQFSGGMRQRIVIAIALAANPDILICDEPTTALDVTIQSQILELINKLKTERNLSIIFITHDLGVVANMADRIGVMYAGKIVEQGTVDEIFYDPRHPYTWALLSSMPDLDTKVKLEPIPGTPPNMIYPPKGDAFANRNKYAMKIDFEEQPPLFKVSDTHYAATWLLHENAPKVEPPKAVVDRINRMKNLEVTDDGK